MCSRRSLGFFVALIAPVLPLFSQDGQPQDANPSSVAVPLKVGGNVKPPRAVFTPDPEYSEQARKKGYQGTCALRLIVGVDGKPHDIELARSIGMGLDEKAIEAVARWRFDPARRDGQPVPVQINIEVAFRLYGGVYGGVEAGGSRIDDLWRRADAGDPKARCELAMAYLKGRDVPKSDVVGLELLRQAANQGYARAQFEMGEYTRQHSGGASDNIAAYTWYAISQRSGWKRSDKKLRELASQMSPEDLSQAQRQAEAWAPNTAK